MLNVSLAFLAISAVERLVVHVVSEPFKGCIACQTFPEEAELHRSPEFESWRFISLLVLLVEGSHVQEAIENLHVLDATEEANAERDRVDLFGYRVDHVLELVEHELKRVLQFVKPKVRVVFGDPIDVALQHHKVLLDLYETLELIHEDRVDFVARVADI